MYGYKTEHRCPYCCGNTDYGYEHGHSFVYCFCLVCGMEGSRYNIEFLGECSAHWHADTHWDWRDVPQLWFDEDVEVM